MIKSDYFYTSQFCTKKALYLTIQRVRELFEIDLRKFPLNYKDFLSRFNRLSYMETSFDSKSICGVLIKNEYEKSAMFINSKLNENEKNFSAFHEFVHYFCHSRTFYQCDSKINFNNDSLEWQANEGAAEFLVPYQIFIPEFINECLISNNITTINENLSQKYNVTTAVIDFRINSLSYEIEQYLQKKPINLLDIKSTSYQKSHGNTKNLRHFHCANCKTKIEYYFNYCPVCGLCFNGTNYNKKIEGILPMHYYDNFIKFKNGKLTYCPRCGNEDISDKSDYCQICGLKLNNSCTNPKCAYNSEGLTFFSRYCPSCGNKSDYFDKNVLKSWDKVQEAILIDEIEISEFTDAALSIEAQNFQQNHTIPAPIEDDDLPFDLAPRKEKLTYFFA